MQLPFCGSANKVVFPFHCLSRTASQNPIGGNKSNGSRHAVAGSSELHFPDKDVLKTGISFKRDVPDELKNRFDLFVFHK